MSGDGAKVLSMGRDPQLVIIGSSGRLDLTHVIDFESRLLTRPVAVHRIDGTPLSAELPRGWVGSFEFERGVSGLDDFVLGIKDEDLNEMYQYITELDGSVTTYQFSQVRFAPAPADARHRLLFSASRKRRI